MEVGLFVPCYVDQLAPEVGLATAAVLERAGCRVVYDPDQTCCGQPLANQGLARAAARVARAHLERFARYEAVVAPSGSCVSMVRRHFGELGVGEDEAGRAARARTWELGEFLVHRLGVDDVGAFFPHRVTLLASCHGWRELGLGHPSERVGRPSTPGPTERLLGKVRGLELVWPDRRDECCGFGGAFSVEAPAVSGRMGRARMQSFAATGAEFVTSTDVSCLLHLAGIRARTGVGPRPIHLAEILAAREGAV